jgi:hypothetical protein
LDNLDKLIFVSKNWPNDPREGCNSPSSLIELIEFGATLAEKLDEYEREFSKDENLKL